MTDFIVVDRPTAYRGRTMSSTTAAVLHTATSGQALRIPLNGRRATTLRGGLARTAKRHGLLFHYRRDGESLIAWCEPREPKTGA